MGIFETPNAQRHQISTIYLVNEKLPAIWKYKTIYYSFFFLISIKQSTIQTSNVPKVDILCLYTSNLVVSL